MQRGFVFFPANSVFLGVIIGMFPPMINSSQILGTTERERWDEFFGFACRARQTEFYNSTLTDLHEVPAELLKVISEYAADAYDFGERLDAENQDYIWSVAEVIGIKKSSIRVRYLGKHSRFSEWIPRDSFRLANLFTHTSAFQDRDVPLIKPHPLSQSQSLGTTPDERSLRILGFSDQCIADALQKKGFHNVINFAFYSDHLERQLRAKKQNTLAIGDKVDVQDFHGTWCIAEVLGVDGIMIRVSYFGWLECYDEWISCESPRIAPAFTHTATKQPLPAHVQEPQTVSFHRIRRCGFSIQAAQEAAAVSDFVQNAINYAFAQQHLRELEGEHNQESAQSIWPSLNMDKFYVGQRVDAKDLYNMWAVGQIAALLPGKAKVRFLGWNGAHNIWVPLVEAKIAPLFTHTNKLQTSGAPAASEEVLQEMLESAGIDDDYVSAEAISRSQMDMHNALNLGFYLLDRQSRTSRLPREAEKFIHRWKPLAGSRSMADWTTTYSLQDRLDLLVRKLVARFVARDTPYVMRPSVTTRFCPAAHIPLSDHSPSCDVHANGDESEKRSSDGMMTTASRVCVADTWRTWNAVFDNG
eukprot:TRINITY_DN337_c0_g2_i1.p1 TRINITY_DN337_c0_g2~~TRINITY_DN337_c0_g2_i1.p1  ORF type:complete len:585 (-),score=103.72 TRINITY_DN337_c0_g2_i1:85-1839(-)